MSIPVLICPVSIHLSILPVYLAVYFVVQLLSEVKWKAVSRVWLFVTPQTIQSHGILQARILEWVPVPFCRGSSQPRDQTQVSHVTDGFFTSWATAKLCPALCDPMDCSMPGSSILHYFSEFDKTHVRWVSEAIQPSHPLSPPFSSCPPSFPAWRSFPVSWLFTSGGPSIGASTSASVLPMNIQGWFPLRLTDLISLLFKGLSRVFSKTTDQKH